MPAPFISYITFNRLGLTAKNLDSLLKTTDDFELHILDSNSNDGTWEYLQSVNDPRIKSRNRLDMNRGPIYAVNLNLSKRKGDQYFIALDSDVQVLTPDWISRFMKVFETFPEAGLLGVPKTAPYQPFLPPVISMEKPGAGYLQLKEGIVGATLDFVPGHCVCLRPELLNLIGYWSEESYFGDAEICIRVNHYTPYKSGFILNIAISMEQSITCDKCTAQQCCRFDRVNDTCFGARDKIYKNEAFVEKNTWKYTEYFKELKEGKRTAYCASVHDPVSILTHTYNKEWADDNFKFYEQNAN